MTTETEHAGTEPAGAACPGPDAVPWLTPEEREVWLGTAALLVHLHGALDAQLQADAGLSMFEYMVLAALSEQPDRALQMSQLATLSSSSLSRLSHTVSRLERQGLVSRQRIPGPGRRTLATLTDAGFDKVVASAPGHVRQVRDLVIDALDSRQLAALREATDLVLARIGDTACRASRGWAT